jgi:hypothetical protein
MRTKEQPELLDQIQAAEFLGLTPNTLMAWRSRKLGPAYIKVGGRAGVPGGRVYYDVRDLLAYIDSRKVHAAEMTR